MNDTVVIGMTVLLFFLTYLSLAKLGSWLERRDIDEYWRSARQQWELLAPYYIALSSVRVGGRPLFHWSIRYYGKSWLELSIVQIEHLLRLLGLPPLAELKMLSERPQTISGVQDSALTMDDGIGNSDVLSK